MVSTDVPKEGQEAIDLVKIEICNPKVLRSTKEADRKNDTNDEVDKPLRKRNECMGHVGG